MKVCANCGGEEGLHQYETLRCPKGGREASVGRPDVWQNTFWDDGKTEDDIEILKEQIRILEMTVQTLKGNMMVNFDKFEDVYTRLLDLENK